MSNDPRIGEIISHYKILSKLGQGGMGIVYKAEDTKLKRTVALKFMPANLLLNADSKTRFINEARAASALDHPRIGTIYEIDQTDDGDLFIAMAFYDGSTLKDKMSAGRLPVEEAMSLFRQIANGLQEAHANGIIHRDVKPANIILTKDGFVKIVDFGLAKLSDTTNITQPGTSMGTPAYMSPEQARAAEVDYRCDIWAVCVIFYEMLTGQLPFKGYDRMSMLYNIVNEPPTPVQAHDDNLPSKFQEIFDKAFNKNMEERYSNIGQLLDDLDGVRLGRTRNLDDVKTVILQPESKPAPVAPIQTKKRSKLPKAAVLIAAVLLASYGGINYFGRNSKPQTNESANETALLKQPNRTDTDKPSPSLPAKKSSENKNESIVKVSDKDGQAPPTNSRKPETKKTTRSETATNKPAAQKVIEAPRLATLSVTSEPAGAMIYINESLSNHKTPFTFTDLKPGKHKIRLALNGYLEETRTFDLEPASDQTASFSLAQEPEATVSISAVLRTGDREQFQIADIFIDGKPFGQTPKTVTLKGGQHTIEAKLFGHESQKSEITLKGGGKESLKFEFGEKNGM